MGSLTDIGARVRTWDAPVIEGVVVRHVNRNGRERSELEALYAVLHLDDGSERQIRRRRLQQVAPPPPASLAALAPSPEATPACSGPPVPEEPPRCAGPRPEYWRENTRAGAIYVEREPGGTFRASLVLPAGAAELAAGLTSRQVANERGVLEADLERTLAHLAGRLTRAAGGH